MTGAACLGHTSLDVRTRRAHFLSLRSGAPRACMHARYSPNGRLLARSLAARMHARVSIGLEQELSRLRYFRILLMKRKVRG